MTSAEKMYILQSRLSSDLKFEMIEWVSSYETTNYEFVLYSKNDVERFLNIETNQELKNKFDQEGIGALVEAECVFAENKFEDAIDYFFDYAYEQKLI